MDEAKISVWKQSLNNIKGIVTSLAPDGAWAKKSEIAHIYDEVLENLDQDLDFLHKNASSLFSAKREMDDLTDDTVHLLRQWYIMERSPSLLSICVHACENYALHITDDLRQALVVASILGEVPNDLPYHSTLHYKKVLLQMIRLITIHNDIYADTDNECDDADMALLMLAACIHDVGHDGKGNTIHGVYHQARLERLSYSILIKYFNAIGFEDKIYYQQMMDRLRVMLLCTDTSPMGDPASFVNQMKTAYRSHFLSTKRAFEGLNLDPELAVLESDGKLAVMALLLHEADMATSSGLSYEVSTFETTLFYKEVGAEDPKPSSVIDFMNTICQRQVLSSAGQKLYSGNMARILALAEKEIRAGDEPFPEAEHSKFLLLHDTGDDDAPRTIN